MKAKASHQNMFVRIVTMPIRAIGKARDYYVNSMINCGNNKIIGLQGTSGTVGLPRSYSVGSALSNDDNDDYRELVRASSARSIGSRLDVNMSGSGRGPGPMPPRSISVGMGKIDEERPCCYFGGDFVVNGNKIGIASSVKNDLKYPRSKTYAAARTAR